MIRLRLPMNASRAGRRPSLPVLVLVTTLCFIVASFAFAIDPLPFKDHAQELRFQALTKQLRCLVCQNESLADSNAPLAADLRREVRALAVSGKNDAQIKEFLVARYGDFVLYDPPVKRVTWLLWFGPFVLLAIGAVIWWFIA